MTAADATTIAGPAGATPNDALGAPGAAADAQRAAGKGYQYRHGDRPLEGFTIQRGAGRGGFGEVYYALSDGGREVALKVVHTYEHIELRGIGQCMNLKSPHLVTIFDVKYGDDGRPWVIMEYVNGPSLRELIDAAPSGLGPQKAAFFLREIGKGLTYLHDCGIVHRDLKPGNIFYENGYVKIGDYGLSKLITASQHSGQTVTVGTVHYMAPEIGVGRYDKGIDVYAMGALLYEMLTGQVPFFGASPGEVLMKHLNTTVDTAGIEEPFASVIRKAMSKDPADRYGSVQEMVEAVFGAEHVRNSVSHFSPDSLTMLAGYAARKASPSGSFTPSDAPAPAGHVNRWCRLGQMKDRVGRLMGETSAGIAEPGRLPPTIFDRATSDPLQLWQRIVLAAVVATIVAIIAGMARGPHLATFVWPATIGATAALLLGWHFVAPTLRHESPWLVRLALGGGAGAVAALFVIRFADNRGISTLHREGGSLLAIIMGLLALDWPARLTVLRPQRVSLRGLAVAAIAGLILASVFGGSMLLVMGVLVGTALSAGLGAGWNRTSAPVAMPAAALVPPNVPRAQAMMPVVATAAAIPMSPPPLPVLAAPLESAGDAMGPANMMPNLRRVPRWARAVWLSIFGAFAIAAVMFLIASANSNGESDGALCFGFALGSAAVAVLGLRRSRVTAFTDYWTYVGRPFLRIVCLQSIVIAVLQMATSRGMNDGADFLVVAFFIVMPCVVLFISHIVSRGGRMSRSTILMPAHVSGGHPSPFTLSGIILGLARFGLTLAGMIALVASLIVALAAITNLPGLFASGTLDPRMPDEITQNFGTTHWPEMLLRLGIGADVVLASIAVGLLLLARRHRGAFHMIRCLLAVGLWFAAVAVLGHALPNWGDVVIGQLEPPRVIAMYVQSIYMPGVLTAAGLAILGAFMFLWPPARPRAIAAAA